MTIRRDRLRAKGPTMRPSKTSGFSLIEILVVVTIIAAILALAVPTYINAQDKFQATACASNLAQMQKNLFMYKDRNNGRWPRESGIRFLLVLHRDGMIEGKDTKVFLCPGTQDINWSEDDPDPGSAYKDWDDLDPMTISYAGRDAASYPVNKNRENEEVIAADDNEQMGGNHRFATNYLYADGAVERFDISLDTKRYDIELPEGQDWIDVGPDSPFEKFQKLRID